MTARSVPEWIGKTPDTAIPRSVKARIMEKQNGKCACCGVKLGMAGEGIEFDHTVALINGGENRESNLRALRQRCHKVKTRKDVAEKARVNRKRDKHFGFKPESRNPLPGGKSSDWKQKVGGGWVRRD